MNVVFHDKPFKLTKENYPLGDTFHVIDNYLSNHESPEDIEVYFCGPPLMNIAVAKMAEDFGVPPENVRFDDFGG